jgi:hypothetical protein
MELDFQTAIIGTVQAVDELVMPASEKPAQNAKYSVRADVFRFASKL